MEPLRIGVLGCTGRTGSAVVRLAAADAELHVAAALSAPEDPLFGQDVGLAVGAGPIEVTVSDTAGPDLDVLVDFSTPAALAHWLPWCRKHKVALVSGTTGLSPEQQQALAAAATEVPVLTAPNMSVGVNLLLQLVSEAATRLGSDWDVEITETHHRHKVDSPSGTAVALYEAVCQAQNRNPDAAGVYGRHGQVGPRQPSEVGIHALRMGGIVGEHSVHFAAAGEVITLEHRAFSRENFAGGAIRAAKWLRNRKPGMYQMRDVLFGAQMP